MNPFFVLDLALTIAKPRTCGDEPATGVKEGSWVNKTPHMRG